MLIIDIDIESYLQGRVYEMFRLEYWAIIDSNRVLFINEHHVSIYNRHIEVCNPCCFISIGDFKMYLEDTSDSKYFIKFQSLIFSTQGAAFMKQLYTNWDRYLSERQDFFIDFRNKRIEELCC